MSNQPSQAIQGNARTVREILQEAHFEIDYYQREYKWESKQIIEMVSDLSLRFLDAYTPGHARKDVAGYPFYFLGSILISHKSSTRYVVDGQQRLTSLTLLLMHLRQLGQAVEGAPSVDKLIFSEKYGEKSFNLDIPDRHECMAALYDGRDFDVEGTSESVVNLVGRSADIAEALPDDITGDALPFFMDWLIDNVQLVVITAFSDDDAYGIFETMNDRGLKLTPSDMLKGYLLAKITDSDAREAANRLWRERTRELDEAAQDGAADFLKTWLRSQYAKTIRERRRGATPEDWDRIGTEFHRWVRENDEAIGLTSWQTFSDFLQTDFDFYSRAYLMVLKATDGSDPALRHVAYNSDREFTLQHQLLLAPLAPTDSSDTVRLKIELAARYVDIVIARRVWNAKSISYSAMQYAMFLTMRAIRRLSVEDLAKVLRDRLYELDEVFGHPGALRVHQQNRFQLHRVIARITDYIHIQSGDQSRYFELVGATGIKHEVEHVWANHWDQHSDEFAHEWDFQQHRNLIGDLLVVPKSFNASYGDLPYAEKVPHYLSQNLLARSLHPQAYERSPGFERFVRDSGLPLRPHVTFTAGTITERGDLYRQLASLVWNPEDLITVAKSAG